MRDLRMSCDVFPLCLVFHHLNKSFNLSFSPLVKTCLTKASRISDKKTPLHLYKSIAATHSCSWHGFIAVRPVTRPEQDKDDIVDDLSAVTQMHSSGESLRDLGLQLRPRDVKSQLLSVM